MSAADKGLIRLDYTGTGTLVLPLGTDEAAESRHVKAGKSIDIDATAWEKAQKLPNVRKLVAGNLLRASRPV